MAYSAIYLRERAQHCRELADTIKSEPLRVQLLKVAEDSDAEADRMQATRGSDKPTAQDEDPSRHREECAERAEAGYRLGVGLMLLNDRGLVFAARRIATPRGAWQMPQGRIDEGEPPRRAALRELREQIGTEAAEIVAESQDWLKYDFPKELLGKAWGGRWRGQRQKWFVMRFTGTDADINLDTERPKFTDWRWLPARQLPDLAVFFKRQLYLDLLAEFPNMVGQGLAAVLADPIVRMTMAADSVSEEDLSVLLRRMARKLRRRDDR